MPADVSGANIRIGATSDGAIAELNRLRSQFALFSREINTKVVGSYQAANKASSVYRQGLTKLGADLTSISNKMLLFGTLPTLFAGQQAYKDYAEVQRLERGLSQYGETLEKVRRIAKEPNIGVFDGAKALIGLRAARIESQLAERAVRSFANAITLGGGNAADLEPALFNLKQFKATQNINQVDLRQLANRVPQTMEVLEKAFGTLDPAKLNQLGIDNFIEGFIAQLEQLPKASGGASVAMEQLADSFTFTSAAFGEGLDKTFGISDKISGLGAILDNLSINFKALNPEAQKSVVWMTSLGVIVPVVTSAVAALVKLWPLIAAGAFPVSTTIAVAVALGTVAAAIGGLVALYPVLTDKTAEYRRQQELVANVAPKLDPLLEKYDRLKAITAPTAEQQKQLKTVIAQIAELVPSAATGWDKYGRAIDVNKGKITSFVTELKKALALMGETRRESLVDENKRDRTRVEQLKRDITSGTRTQTLNSGMGVYNTVTTKLSPAELTKMAEELAQVSSRLVENGKEIIGLGSKGLLKQQQDLTALGEKRLAIENRIKELSTGYINTNELTQINKYKNQLAAIDQEIGAKRPKVVAAINEYNRAKAEARQGGVASDGKKIIPDTPVNQMSIVQLEERIKSLKEKYNNLNPAAKDFKTQQQQIARDVAIANGFLDSQSKLLDDVTKKNKAPKVDKPHLDYIKYLEKIDKLNKEIRENSSVTDSLNLKQFERKNFIGRLSEKGRLGIGDRMNDRLLNLGDQRMNKSISAYQDGINNSTVKSARQGAAFEMKGFLASKTTLVQMMDFFNELKQVAGETDEEFAERVYRIVDLTKAMSQGLSAALQNAAADAGVAFGELLGNLASGTGGIAEFATRLVGTLATMLKDMGKALIAAGTGAIALKVIGKNPYLAIAAGIGLVALGTVTANKIQNNANSATRRFAKGGAVYSEMQAIVGDNPNARFDPEIIAPYSKIEKTIQSGMKQMGSGQQVFIPELTIQGADLVIAFNRANDSNFNLRGY